MYDKDIYILDFETNGTLERIEPTYITQIGIVSLNTAGTLNKRYESHVYCPVELSDFIVKYTEITNELLKDAPKIYEVLNKIEDIIQDDIVAAWPISFEMPILQYWFAQIGQKFLLDRRGVDIGTLARYYMHLNKIPLKPVDGRKVYSLDNVLNSLGFPQVEKRHSALEDAYSEGLVLQKILYGN